MSDHKDHLRRWITGAVGLAVIVSLVGYGSKPIFFLFIAGVLSLVLYEYYGLDFRGPAHRYGGIVLGIGLLTGFFLHGQAMVPAVLTGIVIVLCLLFLNAFQRGDDPYALIGKHLVGLLVIALLLSHVIWLRELEHGRTWIFYLCAVVFAGDTCALYGGKFFGRHRLAPRISPKKTIEGALTGLLGSCLAGVMTARIGIPGFELKMFALLSVVLGIAGQVGDLWESAVKRQAQVKDSGGLLPGHGGFFDRVDSMLFSTPLLYYAVVFLI